MTFELVPNSGQSLDDTRDAIRDNFSILRTAQNLNHSDLDSADQGKHKFLQMPEQSAAPTTAANEGGLYTKEGPHPAETNLFFSGESSGFEYQLTNAISASTARFGYNSSTAPNGWTFLPGGLILQWGSKTNPGTSGSVVYATSNINFPTDVIQVQLQIYHASSGNESATLRQDSLPNSTGFQYRTSSSSANTILKWWSLGY